MNNLSTKLKTAIESPMLPEVRRASGVHPSSASVELSPNPEGRKIAGACLRQQYYRATGEPVSNKTNIDVKISSMIGDQITEMVSDILDTYGFQCGLQRIAAEHSFYVPEIGLSGRCDFLGYDHNTKEYIGIEVKSVGEWKASKCIEKPAEEHVMQSLIYLDHYAKQYPHLNIKKWYILYISRTENYAIKSKKHGSPMAMIWDSYVTIDDKDKCAVVHYKFTSEKWKDFTIENIYKRYKSLNAHLENKVIPDRDYALQYNETRITGMHAAKQLTRKVDIEKVDKWLAKGAIPGKLKVEIGDGECGFCAYKATCWPGDVASDVETPKQLLDNIIITPLKKDTNDTQAWF